MGAQPKWLKKVEKQAEENEVTSFGLKLEVRTLRIQRLS